MKRRSNHKGEAHFVKVIGVWRSNGIKWSTIRLYLRWVHRFRDDCRRWGIMPEEQLTHDSINKWAVQYIRAKELDPAGITHTVHSALWAWSWGLEACGFTVPQWKASALPPPLPPLQDEFRRYRIDVCGVAASTIRWDLNAVQEFLRYGLGAGEVLGLTLDSVDWRRRQVRFVRPKTGREICLPLLPAVARALVASFETWTLSSKSAMMLSVGLSRPNRITRQRPFCRQSFSSSPYCLRGYVGLFSH